jgi:hypothetical protein
MIAHVHLEPVGHAKTHGEAMDRDVLVLGIAVQAVVEQAERDLVFGSV